MFEKIKTPEGRFLSSPCLEAVQIVKILKKKRQSLCVAEVGIGLGATTLALLEQLGAEDTLYLFDFHEVIEEFSADFRNHPLAGKGTNILLFGNSSKQFDSFNWNFAKILLERQRDNTPMEFLDVVYLDGAHTFMHTVAACCLLKKMIKPDGFLIFDDLYWTLEGHLQYNPEKRADMETKFTAEQIKTPHVSMVVDIFMRTDPDYRQVELGEVYANGRAVFQKTAGAVPHSYSKTTS